jgi:steroid delta-isomerase-like uncharacterized protein
MTRADIADLIQRRNEAINRHDVAGLSLLYAADCEVESPMAAGVLNGRQAVRRVYEALFEAIPDITFEPDTLLIDGNLVTVSGWLTGAYTGGFVDLPPSGKPIRLLAVIISTVADGHIIAERRIYDFTGMLVQAGVLKAYSS